MITATALNGRRRRGWRGLLGRPPAAFNPSAFTMTQTCVRPPPMGGAADIFGGGTLSTGTTSDVLCPVQPTATPTSAPTGVPIPPGGTAAPTQSGDYVINGGSAPGAETPTATVWTPVATKPRWLPWAIGGGILAAVGAAAVAFTHR